MAKTCNYCNQKIEGNFMVQLKHVLEKHPDKLSGAEKALMVFTKSKDDNSNATTQ